VHRDVKPANVLFDGNGEAYLTDFGLSTRDVVSDLTSTGQWVGTVAYSAPEQIRGGDVDARADVYALGGVLHHLLTGSVPYPAASEPEALAAHLSSPPPRPTEHDATIPPEFDRIIARAMAKEARARFQSAGDLGRAALAASARRRLPPERGVVATDAAAPRDPTPPRSSHRSRTRLVVAITVGAAVAAAAVAVVAIAFRPSTASNGGGNVAGKPVQLSSTPDALTSTRDAVWAMQSRPGIVARVDARTHGITTVEDHYAIGAQGALSDVAVGRGTIWVAQSDPTAGGLERLAGPASAPVDRVPLASASAIAVGDGALWAGDDLTRFPPVVRNGSTAPRSATVLRLDPVTGRITARIERIGRAVADIAVGPHAVWVALGPGDAVARIEPGSASLVTRVPLAGRADRLALAGSTVWVLDRTAGTITRVDGRTNRTIGAPISIGKKLEDIAAGGDALWVAAADRTLTRLDPHTGRVIGSPIAAGPPPLTLSADAAGVWVASASDGTVTRIVAAS
jgi:serine/threonine-protein kinase